MKLNKSFSHLIQKTKPPEINSPMAFVFLSFFSDTFKWRSVFLSIYKFSGGSISLCPCIRFWIICLRTTFYHPISVSISARWISCHVFAFFLNNVFMLILLLLPKLPIYNVLITSPSFSKFVRTQNCYFSSDSAFSMIFKTLINQ